MPSISSRAFSSGATGAWNRPGMYHRNARPSVVRWQTHSGGQPQRSPCGLWILLIALTGRVYASASGRRGMANGGVAPLHELAMRPAWFEHATSASAGHADENALWRRRAPKTAFLHGPRTIPGHARASLHEADSGRWGMSGARLRQRAWAVARPPRPADRAHSRPARVVRVRAPRRVAAPTRCRASRHRRRTAEGEARWARQPCSGSAITNSANSLR